MGSRITTNKRTPALNLLTLPACCVPGRESSSLTVKRAAQLKWMRERGVQYLGDPRKGEGKPVDATSFEAPVRLVGPEPESASAARMRRAAANEA